MDKVERSFFSAHYWKKLLRDLFNNLSETSECRKKDISKNRNDQFSIRKKKKHF
jgi:hypothetical protein